MMGDEVEREVAVDGGNDQSVLGGDRERRRATTVARRTSGPTRRSTKGHWTPEEDAILDEAVKKYNGKNWKGIARLFKERTDVQCLHRWQKVLNPELIKGAWTKEEDALIINQVAMHGSKNWSVIARSLPGRIGKQCRERWHNHLNPAIKKDAWTKEEEMVLICAHKTYGNKWAEIAKFLPGRSDNSIKNHWNCSLKKRCAQEMPDLVSGITSVELNNFRSEVKLPKTNSEKQNNISPEQKLDADCSSLTLEVSSVDQDSSMERQYQNSPAEEICTPLNGKDENFVPVLWRQVEAARNSISSENFSRSEDSYQQSYSPIHYSTPPDLSLSLGFTPSSPVSILRRAAKGFETPSIIKRQNQSERASENEYQGDNNRIGIIKNDIWSAEQFSRLSRSYLRLGISKRLDSEFDMHWDGSSLQ